MRRLLILLVLLSGCDLYWGGSGDDVCYSEDGCGCGYGYGDDGIGSGAGQQLRNPDTGQCEYGGGGGGGGCYDCGCDDCGCGALVPVPPQQDWGACYGSCDVLDEQSCLVTAGCHAAYTDYYAKDADKPTPGTSTAFMGCWAVAPSGPVHGSCTNLDAHECSRHDDCSAVYVAPFQGWSGSPYSFERCAPEPTTTGCSGVDCGWGSHCEEQCTPCAPNADCAGTCQSMCVPDNSCNTVDCGDGYTCVESCSGRGVVLDGGMTPPGECYPTCVPVNHDDPGSCTGTITCSAPHPACPANTTAGIKDGCYTGYCIPVAACGPGDPGTCTGATCATQPPLCPANTVPGVLNGCWSGYCVPMSACPPPPCETLTTENTCTARNDCTPVYLGDDCTCYPGYCECNILTYEHCESSLMTF